MWSVPDGPRDTWHQEMLAWADEVGRLWLFDSVARLGVRVGLIDAADWFKPQANVYASRRIPSTPVDPEIKAFDKMRS